MFNEVIEKIAAQTGLPVTTVAPVVGALLAHLGDILPAPFAHQLAIMLGIHQEDGTAQQPMPTGAQAAQPGLGGLLGGFAGGGAGNPANVAGASALINVAESLLTGFLTAKR